MAEFDPQKKYQEQEETFVFPNLWLFPSPTS
jgi:hypothetical protein